MFQNIRVRKAQIIGRQHVIEGLNMQDVLHLGVIEETGLQAIYGILCDGCSHDVDQKPVHSEVGARLGADFLNDEIQLLLTAGFPLKLIPVVLHDRLVKYLQKQVGLIPKQDPASQIRFIADKLMFTVVGFIYTESETLIFNQGDGVVIVNDEVTLIDQKDQPAFIGYSAIKREWLPKQVSALPTGFDSRIILSDSIQKMAIASDGLGKEPGFFAELWGHKNPAGLQRRVNVWSLNDHKFKDDLSIITLEKIT